MKIKKILFAAALMFCAAQMGAQNVQLHYDFGRSVYSDEEAERPRMTATYEHFSLDKAGSWFYFVDFDFYNDGMAGAYTEIAREFNLGSEGLAAHLEYDGGLSSSKDGYSSRFQHAMLIGPVYNAHTKDFALTYSVQLMYKRYFNGQYGAKGFDSVQLTGVWDWTFLHRALTFRGYIDLWRGQESPGRGKLIVMTEPQIWWNLNSIPALSSVNLSIGSEIEISNNFIYNTVSSKTFFVNPTLAVKYAF